MIFSKKQIPILFIGTFICAAVYAAEFGGECADFARNVAKTIVKSYEDNNAPRLCAHSGALSDCGARWIYDDWEFGFGKGRIPQKNSLLILEAFDVNANCRYNYLGCGHVAVVKSITSMPGGEIKLISDESNMEKTYGTITRNVEYNFNQADMVVTRNAAPTKYRVRGFVYMEKRPPEFHGAGSLIRPNYDRYGGNMDADRIHNTGEPGLALFQWYRTPLCNHINIGAFDNSGVAYMTKSVSVRTGAWNQRASDKTYSAKLPFSVEASTAMYGWNVTAVTFDAGFSGNLNARCASAGQPIRQPVASPEPLDPRGIQLANGWFWQGNGSIISTIPPGAGFGIGNDKVVLTDSKGAAFFQWQKSSSCPNLKINVGRPGNYKIRLRQWDAPLDNQIVQRTMYLSQIDSSTLYSPEVFSLGIGYYLLAIYSDLSVYGTSELNEINVKCSPY